MWHGYGLLNFGWIGMILFWLLIIGLVALVVWALTNNGRRKSSEKEFEGPLEVIQKRLASGEISVEEYQSIKRELTQKD